MLRYVLQLAVKYFSCFKLFIIYSLFQEYNSDSCNGNGTYECGVCSCNNGYYGDKCQCDSDSLTVDTHDASCRM